MKIEIRLIHDFIAFLLSILLGIALSFSYSMTISLGAFIMAFSLWLLISSYIMQVDFKYALDPRLSRSSVGSLLLLISIPTILVDFRIEARLLAFIIIVAVVLLVLHLYYMSKNKGMDSSRFT